MARRAAGWAIQVCGLAAAITWSPGRAMAQAAADPHAAQPERPTVATHAGTVAPGWLEIETGGELDRYDDAQRGGLVPTVIKIGLGPRLQLTVQAPLTRPPGAEAVRPGDLSAGVKWRLVDDAPIVGDFAVLPAFKAPTGSAESGAGTGTRDVSLLLISSHEFGAVSMDVNAGYTKRSGDGSAAPRTATLWTVSFGGPAHGALGWAAELYGYPRTAGPAGADAIVAVLGGPTFQIRPWFVMDAGIIVPVTGPQPKALYAGLVYNTGRIW